jgi:hypothetical protein
MVLVVECLSSKLKALISNPNTTKTTEETKNTSSTFPPEEKLCPVLLKTPAL